MNYSAFVEIGEFIIKALDLEETVDAAVEHVDNYVEKPSAENAANLIGFVSSQLAGQLIGLGLKKAFPDKGLDAVFGSLRAGLTLDEFKANQRLKRAAFGFLVGQLIELGIKNFQHSDWLQKYFFGPLFGTIDHTWEEIRKLLNIAATIPSPIILDLNGDGVKTIQPSSWTYFDHAGDGFAEQTAWASAEDGLLVRDLNHNGTIDTGAELFGNNTVLANVQKAANGFLALADLDSNKDDKIESSDAAFSELQIWKDSDGDGITSAGKLHSLTELGISSISTAYTASSTVDANGNAHSQTGTYTTTDGQIRAATDVWFKTDSLYSFATEILDVPEDIFNLPEISGYGHMRSLQQATTWVCPVVSGSASPLPGHCSSGPRS